MDSADRAAYGRRLREIRAALEQLLESRDATIRAAHAAAVPVTDIAAAVGLSRMHVYRILDAA